MHEIAFECIFAEAKFNENASENKITHFIDSTMHAMHRRRRFRLYDLLLMRAK